MYLCMYIFGIFSCLVHMYMARIWMYVCSMYVIYMYISNVCVSIHISNVCVCVCVCKYCGLYGLV